MRFDRVLFRAAWWADAAGILPYIRVVGFGITRVGVAWGLSLLVGVTTRFYTQITELRHAGELGRGAEDLGQVGGNPCKVVAKCFEGRATLCGRSDAH